MNVTCPYCTTTYRVDPAKVPAGGVLARCARCPGTFRVGGMTEEEAGAGLPAALAVVAEHPDTEAGTGSPTAVAMGDDTREEYPEVPTGTGPDSLPPVDDSRPDLDELSGGGEDSVSDDEFSGDRDVDYVGASDVAFHTDGAVLEDLPYLEPPAAPTVRDPDEAEPAASATTVAEFEAPSGDSPAVASDSGQEQAAATDGSTSPGETSLPPAPFGARSDPHRRAARLARALVSDIVVYHPERRTRSLRQGTLRQEFREEIRKSWEEYANQVGGDFARQTTYFRDALNEILAGGTAVF